MAHIKNLLLAAVAPLAPSTNPAPNSTVATSSAPIAADWSSFLTLDDPPLVAMRAAAGKFALDLCTPLSRPRWLSLLGPSGVGKTMLARMIYADARVFAERHPYLESGRSRRVKFVAWPRMSDHLRGGEYAYFQDAKDVWLTVIDDIGAEYDARNNFIPSKLCELLNERLGKWTVITSNFGEEQIAKSIDPRVASRLRRNDGQVIEVNVPDFNAKQNSEREPR